MVTNHGEENSEFKRVKLWLNMTLSCIILCGGVGYIYIYIYGGVGRKMGHKYLNECK